MQKMSDDDLADDPVSQFLAAKDARDALPADEERVGWLQHQDGTWAPLAGDGFLGEPVTVEAMLESRSRTALPVAAVDVDPVSVVDTETGE